ncbi:MAG: M1 family metallopeptidase, partial [Candidatus Cloacimonetes bacterium]|nr:M1 family metallopeptidase [Candidatus Cloacimonadota bacterium]
MRLQVKKVLLTLSLFISIGMLFSQTIENVKPGRKYSSPLPQNAYPEEEICRADSAHGFDVLKYEITLTINDALHYIWGNVLTTVIATENLTSMSYELTGFNVSNVLVNGIHATSINYGTHFTFPVNVSAGEQFT